MRFVWLSAMKDLRRLRHEPMSLITWIGIPLFLVVVMTLLFGRNSPKPRGLLLIDDQDNSFVSRFVQSAFSQGALADMITVEKAGAQEGRRRIDHGEASAFLIIPKGFGDAVLLNQPSELRLITNPSQRILPGIIEQALSLLSEGDFYLQAIAGDQLRALAKSGGIGEQSVGATIMTVRRLGGAVGQYLNPPLIDFNLHVVQEQQKQFNFAAAFFPGALILSLLYIASALGADLWAERAVGALRRLATTPAPIEAFLAGKLLAVAIISAVLGLASLVTARGLLGLPVSVIPLAVVWVTCGGALLYLIMQLVQLFATSERMSRVLANLVLFPCAMLGGNFFPFEVMPPAFAAVGRNTPNGFIVARLREILEGGMTPGRIAVSFAIVAGAGLVTFLISVHRLRTRFLA